MEKGKDTQSSSYFVKCTPLNVLCLLFNPHETVANITAFKHVLPHSHMQVAVSVLLLKECLII